MKQVFFILVLPAITAIQQASTKDWRKQDAPSLFASYYITKNVIISGDVLSCTIHVGETHKTLWDIMKS